MTMMSQFSGMMLYSNVLDSGFFFLLILFTGQSFISISSLVLELWRFLFIKDWPEIRKLEITPSEFCPISRDKLEIPNLARLFTLKCYWKLQNARFKAFTISELLRENQQGVKLPPTHIRVKFNNFGTINE